MSCFWFETAAPPTSAAGASTSTRVWVAPTWNPVVCVPPLFSSSSSSLTSSFLLDKKSAIIYFFFLFMVKFCKWIQFSTLIKLRKFPQYEISNTTLQYRKLRSGKKKTEKMLLTLLLYMECPLAQTCRL